MKLSGTVGLFYPCPRLGTSIPGLLIPCYHGMHNASRFVPCQQLTPESPGLVFDLVSGAAYDFRKCSCAGLAEARSSDFVNGFVRRLSYSRAA